jgi:hypothetical protein
MSLPSPKPKRTPAKFTASAKVTVAALSMMGFMGGWNLIARVDSQKSQANAAPPPPVAVPQNPVAAMPQLPALPPIAPLPEIRPVPTLMPLISPYGDLPAVEAQPIAKLDLAPVQVAPLPTMASLPPMPDMPPPPPPPPPAPAPLPAGGWQNSGGS